MKELQMIQSANPAVGACGQASPYMLFRGVAEAADRVDVDLEWEAGEDDGPDEIKMTVIERLGGNAMVLSGAVFDAATGELIRAGQSVSLAKPVPDDMDRAAIAAELAMILAGCVQVETEQRAAA